jgi:hypothetical protein
MDDYKDFEAKASNTEFLSLISTFSINYTRLDKYCKLNYGKGNFIEWISEKINLLSGNEELVKELIMLDYIGDNSLNYEKSPTVINATDYLRKILIDNSIISKWKKSDSRAIFEILKQIRDNITHFGKFEIEDSQFDRNFLIIKIATKLSESMIEKINLL